MTDDLFAYGGNPPSQAHSPTSRAAAESIRHKIGPLHRRILVYLELCLLGATDEQMQDALKLGGNTLRPRRRELQLMNKIRDSGQTRPTQSGRQAVVWVIA